MKAGLVYQSLIASLVFSVFFSVNPPGFPTVGEAKVPTLDVSGNSVASRGSLPPPSLTPLPTFSPEAIAKRATSRASVLGSSTRYVGGMPYGIAGGGGLSSLSDGALAARLDGMKALGVTWVRYDVEWSNIEEQGPGVYSWADYDRVVQAVSARGLNSLAILDYTPGWARRSDCAGTKMCAPADPAAYGRCAAAAAARYTGYGVRTWEIWNEPNNLNFFQPGANADEYTAMLKAAYGAIKGVNGGATVLTGGTAPADSGGGYLSPPDFVNGIYAAGAKGYFDALGHHPYTWPYSPAMYMPGNAWSQLSTLHSIMSAHGDGGKKIWITEFGAPTGGPGGLASSGMTTSEASADHVTEALEAKMATDAVNAAANLPWVGGFFWYSYMDSGTSSDTVENFFGLLRPDGSRKPAYFAYKSAIAAH